MKLNQDEINSYHENGFLLLEDCFSEEEVNLMNAQLPGLMANDSAKRILEKNGFVRAVLGPDQDSGVFECVSRLERLVGPARQLLNGDVYIHQTKLNSKQAVVGDWWEWHQDFPYWYKEDGMPLPRVFTAMIFLNDVNEFNGPLLLIPGSHAEGMVDDAAAASPANDQDDWYDAYLESAPFLTAVTANLKYTLSKNTIAEWVNRRGMVAAKGRAGSVLLFHGSIFHASSSNLSPWDRNAFLITYNSVENTLRAVPNPRPSFLANQDFTPIQPLSDCTLLDLMA